MSNRSAATCINSATPTGAIQARPRSSAPHLSRGLCIDAKSANVLMMTHVLRNLPTAQQNAWVCSSGSKGYCATKEMLQNGIPGHTLLVESGDLRDVGVSNEEGCLLIFCKPKEPSVFAFPQRIPTTVEHITVYGNVNSTPCILLKDWAGLTTLDLGPLSQVKKIHMGFLKGCSGLTALDLSPLSQISVVPEVFLAGCTGLTTLDLSPLSQVTQVQGHFLAGCTGLTALDLSPLSQITWVLKGFLAGCSGLTTLDLGPLSQLTEVQEGLLAGCTGLTALDLGPLSAVRKVESRFLEGCTGVDAVDHPPTHCSAPAGWSVVGSQWVRDKV